MLIHSGVTQSYNTWLYAAGVASEDWNYGISTSKELRLTTNYSLHTKSVSCNTFLQPGFAWMTLLTKPTLACTRLSTPTNWQTTTWLPAKGLADKGSSVTPDGNPADGDPVSATRTRTNPPDANHLSRVAELNSYFVHTRKFLEEFNRTHPSYSEFKSVKTLKFFFLNIITATCRRCLWKLNVFSGFPCECYK